MLLTLILTYITAEVRNQTGVIIPYPAIGKFIVFDILVTLNNSQVDRSYRVIGLDGLFKGVNRRHSSVQKEH